MTTEIQERKTIMFREMRRKKQQLSFEETEEILKYASAGVLALAGDDGYPYAVPVSYVYEDGRIYFHGAGAGHKFDAICREPKASFCVIEEDEVIPERFTTAYSSVIAFGTIRILEDEQEIANAADLLMKKYSPKESAQAREKELKAGLQGSLRLFELNVEHMTGKEGKERKERRAGRSEQS